MIAAQDFCSLFTKVLKDGWGVVPGFDGQLLTQNMIDERIKDSGVRQGASKWVGKKVADAGGLFAYAFRSFGMADCYNPDGSYIKTIFTEFCGETGKLPKGGLLPGMVVFKKHNDVYSGVGLYVGNSSVIEARSMRAGVILTKLNSEWTYWGRLKNIEYDEIVAKTGVRKKDVREMRVLHGPAEITGTYKLFTVRDDKTFSGKVIDQLPVGMKTTVVEDCGEYCKIQYTKVGYIKKEFLKEVTG